jgi:hypothetical protein
MVETRSQRRQASQAGSNGNGNGNDNAVHQEDAKSASSSSSSSTPSIAAAAADNSSVANDNTNTKANANANTNANNDTDNKIDTKTPTITIATFILIAAISVSTFPESLQPVGRPTVNHVWYFGWISALSTGLGVLPLALFPNFDTYWVGVTNGEYILQCVCVLWCCGAVLVFHLNFSRIS